MKAEFEIIDLKDVVTTSGDLQCSTQDCPKTYIDFD